MQSNIVNYSHHAVHYIPRTYLFYNWQVCTLWPLQPISSAPTPYLCNHWSVLCISACMLSHFTHIHLLLTLWTVAHQAPLSVEFPRQEHWSGVPFPPPGDLPDPGIEPTSPALQADSLALSHHGSPLLYL